MARLDILIALERDLMIHSKETHLRWKVCVMSAVQHFPNTIVEGFHRLNQHGSKLKKQDSLYPSPKGKCVHGKCVHGIAGRTKFLRVKFSRFITYPRKQRNLYSSIISSYTVIRKTTRSQDLAKMITYQHKMEQK